MHRIDTKTAQKDKFGAGKNGFTRGNPQTGTPATDLDDDYFDMLQEELCSVVEASGASLEKWRHDQLLTALRALLLSRKNPFGDIKSDGTVKTALENLGLGEAAKRDVGIGANQIPDMSKWTSLKADYGWRLTPDGFLEQWGRGNYGNGDGDFVIPFPNRCAFVLISSDPNDTSYAEISQAFPVSNSKFRVGCATAEGNNVNPANLTCNWYAKGW
ncbi:gp53-like domain-containing protein [Escherichia coli]|uniref:gp53-like domain-containing protein n=1 Tax=Escherichia coli TaxID=562 RepID=UPI00300F3454